VKTSRFFALLKWCFYLCFATALTGAISGCAYRFGNVSRTLPGGYKYISIPVFKNLTQETGIEVGFTNALIQEFERSKVGKVTSQSLSDAKVVGVIQTVQYLPGGKKTSDDPSAKYMPLGTVLATEYRILVTARVSIVRQADNTEIWSGIFNGERTYQAPAVTLAGVNSVNPLYNLSARRQNIDSVASDMMAEAHDRITENF
jgi:hypothetical protein